MRRPAVNVSLALNYRAGGFKPSGYHAVNLAFHITAGLLLFGIVRRSVAASKAFAVAPPLSADVFAFVCVAVWLVHPLTTEVVDYITQRSESMAAIGVLGAIYATLRSLTAASGARRWQSLAVAASGFGMLCKESAAVAPILVALFDATFTGRSLAVVIQRRWKFYGSLAATWLILLALMMHGSRANSVGFSGPIGPLEYLRNQLPLILNYVKLAIVPVNQVLDYGPATALPWSAVWPPALVLTGLIVAALFATQYSPAGRFLVLTALITLAPTSTIVPIFTEAGAERRMYLPLAALIVLAAGVGYRYLRRAFTARSVPAFTAGGLLAMVVLASLSIRRNAEYASPIELWTSVIRARPHCRAETNLGILLQKAGRRPEALAHLTAGADGCPEAAYELGVDADQHQQYAEAEARYLEFIRQRANAVGVERAHKLLGRLYRRQHRLDEAEREFRIALGFAPRDADSLAGLGDVFYDSQRWTEAIAQYQLALQVNPDVVSVRTNLALSLIRVGRLEEARSMLQSVVALSPNSAQGYRNLGLVSMQLGQHAEGIQALRRAAALRPDDPAAHAALALALAQDNQQDEASREFERALALNPNDLELRRAYAATLNRR